MKPTITCIARAGTLSAILWLSLSTTSPALAAVPNTINYQGFLTDATNGQPLSTAVNVSFKLYDALTGGNLIYSETQTVTPSSGVFNVQIGSGSGTPAFSSVAFDKPYWLEITVGTQVLTPRQPLASAATALRARVAEALAPVPGTGTANTALGAASLGANTTGTGNTGLGYGALQVNTTGIYNTGVGAQALLTSTGDYNTALGALALANNGAGSRNTAVGKNALYSSTGTYNTALGAYAGLALTTGSYNIDIGNAGVAGEGNTIRIGDINQTRAFIAGIQGVAISGANAQSVVIDSSTGQLGVAAVGGTGGGNVSYGPSSLLANTSGFNNTALGQSVLQLNTTGAWNTAAGIASLNQNTSGTANAAFGTNALHWNTTGNGNVAVGDASNANNTTGSTNTSVGQFALSQNISGSNNLALGANAGNALTTGSYNIDIANPGVAGEGATTRIGDGNQTRAFVSGIYNVTPANAGAYPVVIDSAGQLGSALTLRVPGNNNVDLNATEGDFQIGNTSARLKIGVGTSAPYTGNVNLMAAGGSSRLALIATGGTTVYSSVAPITGVYLAAGSGSWATYSDRAGKRDITPVDSRSLLQRVAAMPVYRWRYISETSGAEHVGPMAQDFRAAFGLGDSDKSITTVDEGGVALAAIKGLYLKLLASEARAQAKDDELAAMKRELAAIKARLGLK